MISPHLIGSDGMVFIWDAELGGQIKMWPIDATHALEVEPERYSLEKLEPPAVEPVADEPDPSEETEL